jgi:hypothetical protein
MQDSHSRKLPAAQAFGTVAHHREPANGERRTGQGREDHARALTIRELVARSRARQGLPPTIQDPAAIAAVAELVADALTEMGHGP